MENGRYDWNAKTFCPGFTRPLHQVTICHKACYGGAVTVMINTYWVKIKWPERKVMYKRQATHLSLRPTGTTAAALLLPVGITSR